MRQIPHAIETTADKLDMLKSRLLGSSPQNGAKNFQLLSEAAQKTGADISALTSLTETFEVADAPAQHRKVLPANARRRIPKTGGASFRLRGVARLFHDGDAVRMACAAIVLGPCTHKPTAKCRLGWAAQCLLSGVKRTWPIAVQMSAYDPKRTCPLRREYVSDAAFAQSSNMFLV
jgi:hypothetical protein